VLVRNARYFRILPCKKSTAVVFHYFRLLALDIFVEPQLYDHAFQIRRTRSIAVDVMDSPVKEFCDLNSATMRFLKMDSQTSAFDSFMSHEKFDLVFIDGDHSYSGVRNDFMATQDRDTRQGGYFCVSRHRQLCLSWSRSVLE
jgi:Methyltransferase domain